jgi:hypothetical protein
MNTLVDRLRAITSRSLPSDWKDGLECPSCSAESNRYKCLWDMGGCPRNYPEEYEDGVVPWITKVDPLCAEAADTIERLEKELKKYYSA